MSIPKTTGPQPKKINIEKGVFESCGTFYYINLEAMSYERLKRHAEFLPIITYGRNFTDVADFIHGLRMKMTTSDEPLKKVYFDVVQELTNWDQLLLRNTDKYFDGPVDDMLRFCALFCVTKDEDMTIISEAHMEKKIENWRKDMDMLSFFELGTQLLPRYKELLRKLYQETKQESQEIEIPDN